MGEPKSFCPSDPEGCCLEFHETVIVLVALIVVVQLGLKLAVMVFYYGCCLIGSIFRAVVATELEQPKAITPAIKKSHFRKLSRRWSEQEVPHRRHRERSVSPPRRCLQCTLEPVKLTMNVQNEHLPCKEHHRVGRRPYPEYLPCHAPPCYHSCECENRYRPRTTSAPSSYAPVVRYRDVAVGSSEPMLYPGSHERRADVRIGTEYYPRNQVGETQYRSVGVSPDVDYTGAPLQRSHRPTKVYIYPVHPQTPPASRSASPERLHRRRGGITGSQEEQLQEFEPQEPRRRSREPEQQARGAPPRFHTVATSVLQRAVQTNASGPKQPPPPPPQPQQMPWAEAPTGSDWVYRPLK